MNRYAYLGELQSELIEKIEIGLKHVQESNRRMFATDIFGLISHGVERSDLSYEEKWEFINSRAGQYLSNYVGPNTDDLPVHVKKELQLLKIEPK